MGKGKKDTLAAKAAKQIDKNVRAGLKSERDSKKGKGHEGKAYERKAHDVDDDDDDGSGFDNQLQVLRVL